VKGDADEFFQCPHPRMRHWMYGTCNISVSLNVGPYALVENADKRAIYQDGIGFQSWLIWVIGLIL
jgi:hypothetical protein